MELPNIGKRCAFGECKQLDFLPFTCGHCKLIYCKDHYKPDNHTCTNVEAAAPHESQPIKHYQCTFLECLTSNPVEMACPVCKKHFCLLHRHHGCIDKEQSEREKELDKWEAPKRQFELAKAEANRQIDESLNRAKKKSGINKTAIKVQLMRLKGKAVGLKSIPTADRVYFLMFLPLSIGRKSKPVYVSKSWTVGRVIDATADLCDVVNKNNEANSRKLRLFRLSDGSLVSSEMERKVEDLFKDDSLIDGESLVLEYVEITNHDASLENLQQYKDLL